MARVSIPICINVPIYSMYQYGMRAMLWAAWFGHKDAITILVTGGANVAAKNRVSLSLMVEFTQLMMSVETSNEMVVCNDRALHCNIY